MGPRRSPPTGNAGLGSPVSVTVLPPLPSQPLAADTAERQAPTPVAAVAGPGSPARRRGPGRKLVPALALALALGLAAASCGSSSAPDASSSGADPAAPAADETPSSDGSATDGNATDDNATDGAPTGNFPAVEVHDLGAGGTVVLADQLSGGSLPTLIWFWAPH